MSKKRKDHWDITLALGIGLILTVAGILGLSGMMAMPSSVSAATETITVSATVQSYVSLSVTPTTTTITPDLVTSAGATNIGESDYISITGGTNGASGYSLDITSANAGLDYGATDTIDSIGAGSTTLSAGTDGYGAQGVTADGDVTIAAIYDYASSTDIVGAASSTDLDFADTSAPTSGDITWLILKAAAVATKTAGTYTDTITLTLVAS